jgi:phosphate starvation-inducible protein PhoH and related proteins
MSRTYTSNTIKLESLGKLEALTPNQNKAIDSWNKGLHLVMSGSAGTGKTYLAIHLALEDVLDKTTPYEKVMVVRSIVPTRDIGFLPGLEEKLDPYKAPYIGICSEIFQDHDAWKKLEAANKIEFIPTSFIRGHTFNNCIVVVDEMQNLNFHELDSVITRLGQNSKFIMAGDYYQSDFENDREKIGILNFMEIIENLKQFDVVEFTWKDIVRSDFVRDYIMTKEMHGIK